MAGLTGYTADPTGVVLTVAEGTVFQTLADRAGFRTLVAGNQSVEILVSFIEPALSRVSAWPIVAGIAANACLSTL